MLVCIIYLPENILKTIKKGKDKTHIDKLSLKAKKKKNPTKDRMLGKEAQKKQERGQQQQKSKIMNWNPTISITTVKANNLNPLIKSQRLSGHAK